MAIDKTNGTDLGVVVGTGIDTITYAFGSSTDISTEPTTWSDTPPNSEVTQRTYVWMYTKILLTNGASYKSPNYIVGVLPMIGA